MIPHREGTIRRTRTYIYASCVKHYELDKMERIPNSEPKPGAFLADMLCEREGLTF
jgi:hypothetical protein